MLVEQLTIVGSTAIVVFRIAPAIKKIAGIALSLERCRVVINNEDLAQIVRREYNLIELGVVVHRVYVHPIVAHATVTVEVDRVYIKLARIVSDNAIIQGARIKVLYEMIAHAPFPDDFSGQGIHFDNAVKPEVAALGHMLRVAA